jgi:chromosome segregation ATPase
MVPSLQDAVARIAQLELELKETRGTAERAGVEAHETEKAVEDRDRKLREAQQEIARMGEEQKALRYAASSFQLVPKSSRTWTGRRFLLPQSG